MRQFSLLLLAAGLLAGCPLSAPPTCSASTCIGCCDATGACQPGTVTSACGSAGNACDTCVNPQSCTVGPAPRRRVVEREEEAETVASALAR